MDRLLNGVFPPLITPFTTAGDVDEAMFVRNIKRWNSMPLSGYLVLGSNSEAPFLSEREKLRLVELTVQHAKSGRHVLVGSGLESARETIRLTNEAALAGAQAALILTPFYYGDQMTEEALIAYFREVADGARIPILVYNVPKFTRIQVPLRVMQKLAGHPHIIGMKDSSGNIPQLAEFRKALGDRFQILVGTASGWLPALELGVRGGILALANCCGLQCAQVMELFDSGKRSEAQELNRRLLPVNQAVTSTYGVPGLKTACDFLGLEGGAVRTPLRPLNEAQKRELRGILLAAGLLS